MQPDRGELDMAWLLDIDRAAARALRHVAGVSREQFMADERTQDALLRQIMVIGEAVKRLSPEFCASHADVPWQQIARMRDVVIHHYDKVNLDKAWEVAERDIPALRAALLKMIPHEL